jgi:D-alanyl-D-alanine carboxypeptidase
MHFVKKYIDHLSSPVGIAILTIIIIALAFTSWYYYSKAQTLITQVKSLEVATKSAQDEAAKARQEKENLDIALRESAEKSKSFANELDNVTNTLERFERAKEIDPQLLQKYSKVYFLNENYTPSALTEIDTKYLVNKDKPIQIHDRIWLFLKNMLDAAAADGVTIQVASGYRSFATQSQLKASYKVTYGSGANAFSADQGYSEHQLGTTLDVTTPSIGGGLVINFEKTKEFEWLQNNAYKYGFILSYPKNNSYYIYEPWHWRFVGLDLALKLHNENKHFYDLDQRDINSYQMNFFSASLSQPQ